VVRAGKPQPSCTHEPEGPEGGGALEVAKAIEVTQAIEVGACPRSPRPAPGPANLLNALSTPRPAFLCGANCAFTAYPPGATTSRKQVDVVMQISCTTCM